MRERGREKEIKGEEKRHTIEKRERESEREIWRRRERESERSEGKKKKEELGSQRFREKGGFDTRRDRGINKILISKFIDQR